MLGRNPRVRRPARLRLDLGGIRPRGKRPAPRRVYAPGGATPEQVKAFSNYYTQERNIPTKHCFHRKSIINQSKDLALITIIPTTGPNDPATAQLISAIRQVAALGQQKYGLETYVTGQTALNVDISAKLSSALPPYLAVIIILCVLILLLLFRSLLVPLTAVAGYVLSVLAAFGAVTYVFQEGHFDSLFSIATPQPVLSFLPIVLLGILFGLAMDYEVFLVSACARSTPMGMLPPRLAMVTRVAPRLWPRPRSS